ncbi:hypothetical protein [Streptomyces sp. NPDC007205]|uniref:hypothetical protein n=1 Tax=Streptomyces sp. NPDC007205 TaxID=3154316 RepID=UPI00340BA289
MDGIRPASRSPGRRSTVRHPASGRRLFCADHAGSLADRTNASRSLDAVAGLITEGLSESDRARIPGFAEVEVDPDPNHLRLHWKGAPPQRVRSRITGTPTCYLRGQHSFVMVKDRHALHAVRPPKHADATGPDSGTNRLGMTTGFPHRNRTSSTSDYTTRWDVIVISMRRS